MASCCTKLRTEAESSQQPERPCAIRHYCTTTSTATRLTRTVAKAGYWPQPVGSRGLSFCAASMPAGPFGVLVLQLRVDLLRSIRLALALVELRKLKLREPAGTVRRRLGSDLVVELDRLGIAAGLAIELSQRKLGQAQRDRCSIRRQPASACSRPRRSGPLRYT